MSNLNDFLNPAMLPRFIRCLIELFVDGETITAFLGNNSHLDVTSMPSQRSNSHKPLSQEFLSLMLGSALKNNATISSDNPLFSNNNSLTTSWSQTLDQVSTLNEKGLESLYAWLCPIALKKLSSLAKTDFVDMDMSSSSSCVTSMIQKSWFSTTIQKATRNSSCVISCPSSRSTHANGMAKEDTILKVRKIKLRLTSNQRTMLKQWNDHARFSYNCAIWHINYDMEKPSKYDLRNRIVPSKANIHTPWILETPKEVRARAVFEAYTRWKTGIKQVKNKTISHFNLRFRRKRDQQMYGWSIDIPKQAITKEDDKTLMIYKQVTKKAKFKLCEKWTKEIEHDCRIHYDGLDYYIIIPFEHQAKPISERKGVISLDPGVRTFLSGVSNEFKVEMGNDSGSSMFKMLRKLDKHISQRDKAKKKREKKILSKKVKHMRKRIKNMQEELHKKTSTWLTQNFQHIVMPQFGSKDMIKKQKRKLNTKTVRKMSVLGHGKFLERLKNKARERQTDLIIVDEVNTSKTCSFCGYVKAKRFTEKTFRCEECQLVIDRDTNGAINIMKKLFLPVRVENRADRA